MSPKGIAGIFLLIGCASILFLKFFVDESESNQSLATSDAAQIEHNIKIGVDSWAGYYPLCSKFLRSSLRNKGILVSCENDNANVGERLKKLQRGNLQFAVATVDAYLSLGEKTQFPGSIVAVIDESKGGDALVAYEDMVSSIDDLKTNSALRIALTPDSPSEHLTRSLAVHFDLPTLKKRGSWLVESDGSAQAFERLKQKSVDAAVLWEPDVTKALKLDGVKKIIGSEDTERLIVDVLLVERDFLAKHPQVVETFLDAYFETLRYYHDNPQGLINELAKETGLNSADVQAMLEGVKWASLSDNALDWFSVSSSGYSNEYLVEAINSAMTILFETGVLKNNPLPDSNPYLLTQSRFVEQLFTQKYGQLKEMSAQKQVTQEFAVLSDKQWDQLREIGTLKVRKISFSPSSSLLSLDAKQVLDQAANDLLHYPNYRIMIKGHTNTSGDAAANLTLSQDRAEAVLRYLNIAHGIAENRLYAKGVGSNEPLARLPNESKRSYGYRLPRVELILKTGTM